MRPNKLKSEAARRIREDDVSPGDIAAEIGAHECLVRKWSVADRRSQDEAFSKEGPAFAPDHIAPDLSATGVATRQSDASSVAKLELGNVRLEFSTDIAESALISIIRAMEQAT